MSSAAPVIIDILNYFEFQIVVAEVSTLACLGVSILCRVSPEDWMTGRLFDGMCTACTSCTDL